MFARANFFDTDISKWDVSRVKDMGGMFLGATSFNGDLSRWDVSSVKNMNGMFLGATLFKRKLCTAAWVHSDASKNSMFEGSSASISSTVCGDDDTDYNAHAVFSPRSTEVLKIAVNKHLIHSAKNADSSGPLGPIGGWDVSRVTDMHTMFADAKVYGRDESEWDHDMFWGMILFNGDISKWDVSRVIAMSRAFSYLASFNGDISRWDVSRVRDMSSMFWGAISFNGDISRWDVSSVKDMSSMFYGATAFARKLCTTAWVNSRAHKTDMFEGSSGSISTTVCRHRVASTFSPQSRTQLKSAVDAIEKECATKAGGQVGGPEAAHPPSGGTKGNNGRHHNDNDENPAGVTMGSTRFEVFFDGECPLCVKEIRMLQWLDRKNHRLIFTDIAAPDFDAVKATGKTYDDLMAEIYGRLPSGELVKGVEVFRQMYAAVGLGFLFAPTKWPVLEPMFEKAYLMFARNRLRLTGRCNSKTGCQLRTPSP